MSEADARAVARQSSAKMYDFVHPGHRLEADWPVLETVHQRFVSALSTRLNERFHLPLSCDVAPTRRTRYRDFVAALDGHALVHEYSLGPLPGVALLSIEAGFVPALVDGWFGGKPGLQANQAVAEIEAAQTDAESDEASAGERDDNDATATTDDDADDDGVRAVGDSATDNAGNETAEADTGVTPAGLPAHRPVGLHSATERRALGYVLDTVSATLAEAWTGIATFSPAVARSTSVERLARGGYGDVMVECPFSLTPFGQSYAACLTFSAATLEPFGNALAREDHSHPVRDAGFRGALGRELLGCELELHGVLAETRITLAELMAMKPGDFIPLRDVQNVSFQSQSMPLFDARVGKSNGRVSASLSRWHLPTRS